VSLMGGKSLPSPLCCRRKMRIGRWMIFDDDGDARKLETRLAFQPNSEPTEMSDTRKFTSRITSLGIMNHEHG